MSFEDQRPRKIESRSLAAFADEIESIHQTRSSDLTARLSDVERRLSAARDELRLELRGHEGAPDNHRRRVALERINQSLSLLHSVAYPQAGIPWHALQMAAKALREAT